MLLRRHRKPTIGVILPMRSGFYMGEISSTLRAYGAEQGINLIFLRVGQSRDFDIPFAFDHIDGLIVVLRAAASTLVEKTVQKGIPVISVAANYAPLTVESLSSDQASGVNALYDHLTALGQVDIGFVAISQLTTLEYVLKRFRDVPSILVIRLRNGTSSMPATPLCRGAEKRMSAHPLNCTRHYIHKDNLGLLPL